MLISNDVILHFPSLCFDGFVWRSGLCEICLHGATLEADYALWMRCLASRCARHGISEGVLGSVRLNLTSVCILNWLSSRLRRLTYPAPVRPAYRYLPVVLAISVTTDPKTVIQPSN